MKRKLLCIAMVMIMAFGVFALSGCGGDDKAADSDKLIVGLDDTFAPMGFRDEAGELVGFDIDLASAVGEELGMDVEFKPTTGMQRRWSLIRVQLAVYGTECQ